MQESSLCQLRAVTLIETTKKYPISPFATITKKAPTFPLQSEACDLWSIAEPSQNKRERVRTEKPDQSVSQSYNGWIDG